MTNEKCNIKHNLSKAQYVQPTIIHEKFRLPSHLASPKAVLACNLFSGYLTRVLTPATKMSIIIIYNLNILVEITYKKRSF